MTREQIAVILWRSAGSPAPSGASEAFADQAAISPFAVSAVNWARETGIIGGKNANRFDPLGQATRAEVAAILMNLSRADIAAPGETPDEAAGDTEPQEGASSGNVLTLYFTRTGTTASMAQAIHDAVGGDILEIEPVTPYPADYQQALAVAQQELQANARPEIATVIDAMESYDTIFIGYPIWHGTAPMAVLTFLESHDLSGKTVVPFATSGSSGISASQRAVAQACPDSAVPDGLCLTSANSANPQAPVAAWLETLNLPAIPQ